MAVEAHKESLEFQTEVRQLLDLMIHSLYSNKEIFLRELISNGSDAVDKLRFEALTDDALFESDTDLKLQIDVDSENRTITISDNGIGMNRQEVTENIGTIAKSGTRQFFETLTGDQAKDANLIGQFGVGFYSAFIIADKVTLVTRRAGLGKEHGVRWESEGKGEYSLETVEKETRGTAITLHLREGEDEFLESYRLRSIVRKYSDHIPIPIYMKPEPKPKMTEDEEIEEEPADFYETVNKANALWTRPKSEITEEEYKEFYKHISHDFDDPLAHVHNRVEGKQSYISLLYLPKRAPYDLWNKERKHGMKLYVRRVFIMDNAEELMPNYLRFIKGVIDSDDLPLNISREILQQNKLIDSIRSASVKRVLDLLENIANKEKDQYKEFWSNFGKAIKEGLSEDFGNRERLAKLLRFSSTFDDKEEQTISLDDYIARMKDGQDKIYYVTADRFSAAKNSPHLEVFRKKGIEVLLLGDRVDEWMMPHLTEYEGKSLVAVAKGDLDLSNFEDEEEKQQNEQVEKDYSDMIEKMKEVLKDKVKEVRVSHRLVDSPSCLVVNQHDMAISMQTLLEQSGHKMPAGRPVLEVNPGHPFVKRLHENISADHFDDWTHVLYDQATLSEGGQVEDPAAFVHRFNDIMLALIK